LIAYVAAVAGSLLDSNLRKQGETRLLLVMLGVYWVAMSIFNQKLSYYLIHILPWYVALLAGWCRWLWIGRPRLRPVVAAVVLLLCAVDSGGILLKARDRSYVVREREALDFLRKNAAPSARIVGSAALIYGLEFNPNLRDDPYLGLKGGLRPDAVVIEQLYRGYYAGWAEERPVDVRAIRARLAEYRLAYRSPDYEVYLGPAH
jgi:hypothetical protein